MQIKSLVSNFMGICLLTAGIFLVTVTTTIPSYAAGGGTMTGGSILPEKRKSPRELAIDNYNAGIAYRDKAEALQTHLAISDSEKERAKLQKKTRKAFKQAAKRYRSAIKQMPELYQAHGSLGYALKQTGDFEGALIAYNESIRLRPEYTPAIEYRAEAHLALGQFEDVMKAYGQLEMTDPPRRDELKAALQDWLLATQRVEANLGFYDWVQSLDAMPVAPALNVPQ